MFDNDRNRQITVRHMEELNPGKDAEAIADVFDRKKNKNRVMILIASLAIGLLMFVSSSYKNPISEEGTIERNDYLQNDKEIPLTVKSEEYGEKEIAVKVASRKHTDEEINVIFSELKEALPDLIKGENKDLLRVDSDLVFPNNDETTGVELTYLSSAYDIVDDKGHVKNGSLEKPVDMSVTVRMYLEGKEDETIVPLRVFPISYSEEESFYNDVDKALAEADEKSKEEERLILPKTVDGKDITFKPREDKTYLFVIILGVMCAYAVGIGMDRDLEKSCVERRNKLLDLYPGFVSKLAVLTGAGMNISQAVKKIYADEEKNGSSPLTEELGIYVRNVKNGVLEDKALHDLGQRCGISEYRKFTSILSTNAKKGSINLKKVLEEEAETAFANHQSRIRKLGEEAGTKLLLPMIMMLMVVMVIVMVPAFMTYQI